MSATSQSLPLGWEDVTSAGLVEGVLFGIRDFSRLALFHVDEGRSLPDYEFCEAEEVDAAVATAFGRFVVIAHADEDSRWIRIFDVELQEEVAVSVTSGNGIESLIPIKVSVLQASPGPLVWLLLAVGCEHGECFLFRHGLSHTLSDTTDARRADPGAFFTNAFLPQNCIAVVSRHIAAGVDAPICSFAFLAHEYMAVGYASGDIVIHRITGKTGHFMTKHTAVSGQEAPVHMAFPSRSRLVVGREHWLQMVQLSVQNELLEARNATRRPLEGRLIWLGVRKGLVSYAVMGDGVMLRREPHVDIPFDFGAPQRLLSGPQESFLAFSLAEAGDDCVEATLAAGGKVFRAQGYGAGAQAIRDALTAGRDALEPPRSHAVLSRALEAGWVTDTAAVAGRQRSDDECAELVMQLCLEHGCLGVLQDALQENGGKAARAAHLREWTRGYAQGALANSLALAVNPQTLTNVLEECLARLGALYRLQESLANGLGEQERVDAEMAAGKTLAEAFRLETVLALRSTGLESESQLEGFYPATEIESAYRARRLALGGDKGGRVYLFCDHLWHLLHTGSGIPDGSHLWPPASFPALLAALAASPALLPAKHAVLLFALLDAGARGSAASVVEHAAGPLITQLAMSSVWEQRTRAWWMIDCNIDVSRAAIILASVGAGELGGNESMGSLAVSRLLVAGEGDASRRLLRSLPPARTADAVEGALATLLALNDAAAALEFCREQGGGDILPLLIVCDRSGRLGLLARLPLKRAEEDIFFSFVATMAAESGRELRDLLVVYLLLRKRTTEASALWARVRVSVAGRSAADASRMDALVEQASSAAGQPECVARGVGLSASLLQPPVYCVADSGENQSVAMELDDNDNDRSLGVGATPFGVSYTENSSVFMPLSTPVRSIRR